MRSTFDVCVEFDKSLKASVCSVEASFGYSLFVCVIVCSFV